MRVIDVDTHFEPGRAWLSEYPKLANRLPEFSVAESTLQATVGDLMANVPLEQRPSEEQLMPPGIAAILREEAVADYGFDGSAMHAVVPIPSARLGWMDKVGVDVANVICLEGAMYARYLDDRTLAREAIGTCNTWLADQVSGNERRLMPLTCIDATDIDWSIAELTRLRARGSRSFLIGTLPAPGIPPMNPYYERLWSAAEDLGMMAVVHIGYNPTSFDPAWANSSDMMVLRQLGVCQGHQSVQLMMNGMVFGGVFDRHPKLTVLFAEFGLHWFAGTVQHMESRGPRLPESAVYFGRYPYELTPGEFVRRNIRVTPLPRAHQSPVQLLAEYPECVVFSSDYAHNESNPEPTAHYDKLLADMDPIVRKGFLGGTIADSFVRMGDPLAERGL